MGIDASAQQFIAGLERVAAANEREVLLHADRFVDIDRLSFREAEIELTAARCLEYGHCFRPDVRYAELRRPVLPQAVGKSRALSPVPTQAHFVDRGGIDYVR